MFITSIDYATADLLVPSRKVNRDALPGSSAHLHHTLRRPGHQDSRTIPTAAAATRHGLQQAQYSTGCDFVRNSRRAPAFRNGKKQLHRLTHSRCPYTVLQPTRQAT